jgi:hypothetical protein
LKSIGQKIKILEHLQHNSDGSRSALWGGGTKRKNAWFPNTEHDVIFAAGNY